VTTVIWRTTGRSPSSSTRSAIPTGYWPWWPEGKAAHTRPPALEPLARTLPYDLAVTAGGAPAAALGKITAPVLILGGSSSPAWFRRSVAEQAAATPGARLTMLDGYDHNAPPEVITPILASFFGTRR